MTISPLFRRITLIQFEFDGGSEGEKDECTATGLFFSHNDGLYLATCKHVFEGEVDNLPSEIDILLRGKARSEIPERRSIRLKDEGGTLLLKEHPNVNADVVLLPLPDLNFKQHGVQFFSEENFYTMKPERSKVGRGAMVVGYPQPSDRIIKDTKTDHPVAISSLISSEYGSEFDGQPYFLIDANAYDGMSGSPVVIRPGPDFSFSSGSTWSGDSAKFIGIHSGPYQEVEGLNLNRVWYPYLLREIAESFD